MPGTITFKPIEAKLTRDMHMFSKMSPYCAFSVGSEKAVSGASSKGGKNPHWDESVSLPLLKNQPKIMVQLMDKDTKDDIIGDFAFDLKELQTQGGQLSRWYPLTYKNKPAGEILMESSLRSDSGMASEHDDLQSLAKEEVILDQIPENKTFVQQTQVIEPRTFLKEVDVVETRSVTQNIEVMEPVKVMKDVQYTKAVPVTKKIEVVEPHVVMKEIEVMEPQLVTKQIQVIENVPVKRQVEVIESRTTTKEVETFEPQTFTKQIEVTEHVPVMKQVEVSEPVHLKKNVEFIEPVITTKTITKQMQEAVIIDEKVTKTVGPATIMDVGSEIKTGKLIGQSGSTKVSGTEKILEKDLSSKTGSHHQKNQKKL